MMNWHTVGSVSGLVAHQRVVALLRLDNGWRLKVNILKHVDRLSQVTDFIIERSDPVISSLFSVSGRVEGVCLAVLVVGEHAKVLRPVTGRGKDIDELVWTLGSV